MTSMEHDLLQLIDERDAAEECIRDIYSKIVGRSPPSYWSSNFTLSDALNDIEEAVNLLKGATLSTIEAGEIQSSDGGVEKHTRDGAAAAPIPNVCAGVAPGPSEAIGARTREEQIARIINPDLFVEYDLLVTEGAIAANGKPWAEVVFGKKIEALLVKARAVLSLSGPTRETEPNE